MRKLIVILLIVTVFSGCATSKVIKNDVKTLGMVGSYVETDNPDVATVKIKRGKIIITPVAEGATLLFISNELADIIITPIIVQKTGAVFLGNIDKYTEQPSNSVLSDTIWSYSDDDGIETLHFYRGTKGLYTVTDTVGSSYSAHFSYIVSENEITFMFAIDGITATTGLFSGDVIYLEVINDNVMSKQTLPFRRIKE